MLCFLNWFHSSSRSFILLAVASFLQLFIRCCVVVFFTVGFSSSMAVLMIMSQYCALSLRDVTMSQYRMRK